MGIAGLSPERGARSAAARGSTGTLERPVRRPRAVSAAPATDRSADDPDKAPSDDADRQQADYFLHLLAGRRRLIDHRVDEYQKAVAVAEANGDAEAACRFRRLVRLPMPERQAGAGMMGKAHRGVC